MGATAYSADDRNLADFLARMNVFPRPPRTFAEWSNATDEHIRRAYRLVSLEHVAGFCLI